MTCSLCGVRGCISVRCKYCGKLTHCFMGHVSCACGASYKSKEHAPLKIDTAAIKVNGEVWTLPRPARHHILINAWSASYYSNGENATLPRHEQGFITSRGNFVDRENAAEIAYKAKQIDTPKKFLFSEDLW